MHTIVQFVSIHEVGDKPILRITSTSMILLFLCMLFNQRIICAILTIRCTFHFPRGGERSIRSDQITCVSAHVPHLLQCQRGRSLFTSPIDIRTCAQRRADVPEQDFTRAGFCVYMISKFIFRTTPNQLSYNCFRMAFYRFNGTISCGV